MNTLSIEPKVGDHAVIKLFDGSTASCTVTMTNDKAVRFAWKAGPGAFDERWVWIPRAEFADRVTLFPAGTKFMVVEPVPMNAKTEYEVILVGSEGRVVMQTFTEAQGGEVGARGYAQLLLEQTPSLQLEIEVVFTKSETTRIIRL